MLSRLCFSAFVLLPSLVTYSATAAESATEAPPLPAALNFDLKTLAGKDVNLAEKYAGQVVLLVNVASKCGLTPQYEALQALHEKYADQGLAIVGAPCNQFGRQEPGDAGEIAEFCEANYGVEFDMLAKVKVKKNKPGQCALYAFLTSEETNPDYAGNIQWNFTKFLISREGKVVARFSPRVEPDAEEVLVTLESELAKPAPPSDAAQPQ